MYEARDWVGFILDLPMANDPGTTASYCTGGVIDLGSVIASRSSMALDAYAAAYLFGPLGIQQTAWRRSPDNSATGGGGLRLRPRDAVKFGQLYLNGGVWWKRSFAHGGATVDSFFTSGNGGNFIFVFPALDLVVAFTGSNYNSPLGDQPFQIVGEYVLPAVR